MKSPRAAQRKHLATSPFQPPAEPPPVEVFDLDDRVSHDKYGLGRVIEVTDDAVVVDFGTSRVRIAAPYPKLTKL